MFQTTNQIYKYPGVLAKKLFNQGYTQNGADNIIQNSS